MCSSSSNKTTPSMNKKRLPRARKSRTKAKKPKFLSLRLQFPAEEALAARRNGETNSAGTSAAAVAVATSPAADTKSHGLNLFPLHPENQQLQDRESTQDQENVAFFFSATDGGATTLTGLLDDSTNTPSISSHTTNNNSNRRDDLSPSSASLTYTYGGHESNDGAALVRNAMKSRERDSSEEKWVSYSEVVERKIKEEEVTSSAVDPRLSNDRAVIQGLSLKLDYQEILNAWSNKGPLYVDAENSQIVPDMSDDFPLQESSYNLMGWGCNNKVKMGLWTVPEMGQREASVLRYKEKRRNRLFSKKIRYQVRKLNAEKRPRLKGRFVKRS